MRVAHTATTLSWIPSESAEGMLEAGFRVGLAHYDRPPSDVLSGPDEVRRLRDDDRFRFANVLAGWAEFSDDGAPIAWGYGDESGVVMGSTTVRIASVGATFAGVSLPTLRPSPEVGTSSVRLVQTVGGRTGVPLPRAVPRTPVLRWQAPIVWTTLALTLHSDGRGEVELAGASPFPRHWVFGTDGRLMGKSGLTDMKRWLSDSFGPRTPWGEQDSSVMVAAVESAAERELSAQIMQAGRRPTVERLAAGAEIVRQGDTGADVYLVLDGVCAVEVDGRVVGQVGPGAIVGERAVLEGGRRTATMTALTPVRLAVASSEDLDRERLAEVAREHRREDA